MTDASDHHGGGKRCRCCDPGPAQPSFEAAMSDQVEQTLLHGLFPQPILRREMLRKVGASAIIGALSSILPIETLKAIAQERKPLEKTKLAVAFCRLPAPFR
ncbi:hypothetical protein [Bradyrhizobium sp. BR 1432]|uniref:hypothetical protein n=1 Tax=Bradyrhizobium sp. BR 1432 TaxID=3447966 RepID=UPI003EE807B8